MLWNEEVTPERQNAVLEAVMPKVDLELCAALVARYAGQGLQEKRSKYAKDPKKTMRVAVKRALRLGLDQSPPLRILDIGTGAGFFALVCAHFGHRCETLDTEETGFFADMVRGHGVAQEVAWIKAFTPFPAPGPYDLITAFAIAFDMAPDRSMWGVPEWSDFLDRASGALTPEGRIAIHFNASYDGARYTPEILAELKRRGAEVEEYWAVIPKA